MELEKVLKINKLLPPAIKNLMDGNFCYNKLSAEATQDAKETFGKKIGNEFNLF